MLVLLTAGILPAVSRADSGSATGVASASVAAAAVPPELLALEQKTLALQVTSEHFSLSETITGAESAGGLFARVSRSLPLITVTGEESFTPVQASFQGTFLGLKSNGRLIGTTLYIEEPMLGREDGGRPWVEEPNQRLEQATGVELGGLGGSAGSGAPAAFGGLIEELNKASNVQDLGPTTVDGQATTAFRGSVDLSRLTSVDAAKKRALLKVVKPLVKIELFFTEAGLPIRTRLMLTFRRHRREPKSELIAQSDVLAVNVPIATVEPPPADETITEAQLKKLLKRTLPKSRKHEKIVPLHRPPK